MENTELAEDYIRLHPLNGLFVGLLDEDEREAFDRLCMKALAKIDYSGVGGTLGLGKVKLFS